MGEVLIAICTRVYMRKEFCGVCGVCGVGRGGAVVGKAPRLPFPGRPNILNSYDQYLE